jgi:shikimate kinase
VHLGGIDAAAPAELPADLDAAADASPLRTLDPEAEARMIARIDDAKRSGNTLGGVCEVVVRGLPVGLGSHVSWDRKLDGRLAQALMSIPAVKGVEIGLGFEAARRSGAEVHDEIAPAPGRAGAGNVRRATNRAGGLEGGITTGEPLVLRVAMKPISTLMRPLGTIDVRTGAEASAAAERSDVTAVPAMGVIAEAMTAFVLAQALLEKCGGDSLVEVRRNLTGYVAHVAGRIAAPATDGGEAVQGDAAPEGTAPGAPGPGADHAAAMEPRVVLVGLPGAGKSTVGPLVAARLGWTFLDFDAELARREGRSVAEQFAQDGEAGFRTREAALSGELALRPAGAMVLAPGGGWMTNAAARRALAGVARTVYLRVRPATAARRLAADAVVRPLLAGAADPVHALATLLARRGPAYEAADLVIDAESDAPEDVAAAVAAAVAALVGGRGAGVVEPGPESTGADAARVEVGG